MKRLLIILITVLFIGGLHAQEDSLKFGKVEILEKDGKTTVNVGGDMVIFEENNDTTRIKLGNKGVTIIEDEEGNSTVDWEDLKDNDEDSTDEQDDDTPKKKKTYKFKPHWAAFEMGMNNYVNNDWSMNISPDFMDLNTSRSWNFNLNFMEHGFPLGTNKVGLVTGLGAEFMNYHFDGNNVIIEDANGMIIESPIVGAVKEAKLQTTYLTAPLLLEFQVPTGKKGKKRLYISGGIVGAVKIGSKTKAVYTDNGDKQKDKVKDDFNLSPLRYGFTARIGYKDLGFYATYYPVSLFESGKGTGGDQLYPFAIGLSLINF